MIKMWANRNPASHDLGRIMRARVSKTVARNHVAAIRGSSYYAYDQDPLQREVKATAGLMDRLTGPEVGEWKKGGMFGNAGDFSEFYEEREKTIADLKEDQTHAIQHINTMINNRTRLMALYDEALTKAVKARKARDDLDSEAHRNIGKFLQYVGANVGNKDVIQTLSGESYTEIESKYNSTQSLIQNEQKIITDNEKLMGELEDEITKQDNAIRDAADVAGIDLPDTLDKFQAGLANDALPFFLGGITAIGIGLLLSKRRGRTPPAKGRSGSAYNVFMGR